MNQLPNQQDPGIERRLLLVFALTFVVIVGMQQYFAKVQPPPAQTQPKAVVQAPAPTPPPISAIASAAAGPASASGATGAAPAATGNPADVKAPAEAQTIVDTDVFHITFTNRGAQVTSWILKKYTDDNDKPLELVNSAAAAKFGLPMSLFVYDAALRDKLSSALYVSSVSGMVNTPADLTFQFTEGDLVVRKTFHFDSSYVLKIETSVQQHGSYVTALPSWPSGFGDEPGIPAYAQARVSFQTADKTQRLKAGDVSGGNTLPGPFTWAGTTSRYFTAIFLPGDATNTEMVTFHNALELPKDASKADSAVVKVSVLGAAVGSKDGPTALRLFVGPKAFDTLKEVRTGADGTGPDLTGVVDFGKYLFFIASPLFLWLKWTYNHMVQNWGWAIAIQTLIINLALLPLRVTSMKSALKMQKLQPQMDAVKRKYEKFKRDDPRKQEMNKEIGALMQSQGVNPIGGCLPLVLQMPFLIAYYTVLQAAFELRHAPWLWIHDLASADPYHLLPFGVVATMFLTQRMTPSPGMDPVQQKMMSFMMPAMLGFISFTLPAGLCLYWVVGSVIGIAQQQVMTRTSLGKEMRELAEKRARNAKKK